MLEARLKAWKLKKPAVLQTSAVALAAAGCFLFSGALAADVSSSELAAVRAKVDAAPQDAKLRLELARALRGAGKNYEAATECLETSALEPGMYVAYHELALCKPTNEQMDEAIERLQHLRDLRPTELMLRVALSELLELRGDNYASARALVDLVYSNKVPQQYLPKVQARIHYLLSKAKDAQTAQNARTDEGTLDTLPAPLPESSLRRSSIAASKTKNGQGFGHSTLLP